MTDIFSRPKTAFIIGNGPSVRVDDLSLLAPHTCFAANRFHLSYHQHDMRPAATFCIDPQMINDHLSEIAKNCRSDLFIPRQFAMRARMALGFRRHNIHYFSFDRGNVPLQFSFMFPKASGNGASVLFSAMQYAASQNIQEIFLYGIDHYFKHSIPDASGRVRDKGENNHFINGYRQPGGQWFPPDINRIEAAFRLAKQVCDKRGIKIWNATRGGKLEIFDRIDFDNALEKVNTTYGI